MYGVGLGLFVLSFAVDSVISLVIFFAIFVNFFIVCWENLLR